MVHSRKQVPDAKEVSHSIKLNKLVEWTELTVLAFCPIRSRVLVLLLHKFIKTSSRNYGQ